MSLNDKSGFTLASGKKNDKSHENEKNKQSKEKAKPTVRTKNDKPLLLTGLASFLIYMGWKGGAPVKG